MKTLFRPAGLSDPSVSAVRGLENDAAASNYIARIDIHELDAGQTIGRSAGLGVPCRPASQYKCP